MLEKRGNERNLVLNRGECHAQEEVEPEQRAAKFINSKIKCCRPCKTSSIEQHKVAGKKATRAKLGKLNIQQLSSAEEKRASLKRGFQL